MISVVICTYNARKTLPRLLEDMAGQEADPASFELVFVDNNSRDGTTGLLNRFIGENSGLRARLVREPAQGKSYALNTGVRACAGDVIAFLDDDMAVPGDWLARVFEAFESPGVAGIGGRILPLWEGRPPSWLTGATAAFTPVHDLGEAPLAYRPPWSGPVGANMAVRRDVLLATGLFDTRLGHIRKGKTGGEESDLFLRLHDQGRLLAYWPDALAFHRFDAWEKSRAFWLRRAFVQGRTAARCLEKNDYSLPGLIMDRACSHGQGSRMPDAKWRLNRLFSRSHAVRGNDSSEGRACRQAQTTRFPAVQGRMDGKKNGFYYTWKALFYGGFVLGCTL